MDEFEKLWSSQDAAEEKVDEKTPEYLIRDAEGYYSILADLVILYTHAVLGDPLVEEKEYFEGE